MLVLTRFMTQLRKYCDKIGPTLRGVEPYLKIKLPGLAEQPVPKCENFQDKIAQPVEDCEEYYDQVKESLHRPPPGFTRFSSHEITSFLQGIK